MSVKPTPKVVEDLLALEPNRESNSPNVHPCEGADFHSPRPLRTHGYRLANGKNLWICGTCKDNLDTYLNLWKRNNGLPWSVQRCFGNNIRSLANMVLLNTEGVK